VHNIRHMSYIAKSSEVHHIHTCMTIKTSVHLRYNGMFDVDCSNIGVRGTPKTNLIPLVEPVRITPTAKPKGLEQRNQFVQPRPEQRNPFVQPGPEQRNQFVQSHEVDDTHTKKLCDIPPLRSLYNSQRNQPTSNQTSTNVYSSTKPPTQLNVLLQRETIASMYIASMFIGFAVLGIVGGAKSQQHVFLSFSLFYGVFIPVVILHGTSVIHRVWAAVPMLIYLIYAPVSVSLSIIHKSHIYISISLIMVGFCFVMAGVGGWIRVASVVLLTLFTSLCFGGALNSPDRGDVVALVVIPTLQIIYVCLAGVVSVITTPVSGIENNLNQTGYQDRLIQVT